MLSYPIDEAEELLSSKFAAAQQNLANCEEDLDFLREQITVSGLNKAILRNKQQLGIATDELLDYGGRYGESV